MLNYEAPNPYPEPTTSSFSSLSSLSSVSTSESIGKLVLPAQWRRPKETDTNNLNLLASSYALAIDGGFIATHDQAVLDTIEFKPNSESTKPLSEQNVIIKFNGNNMQYQDVLFQCASDAYKLNSTVVGFNYRGVGDSTKAPKTFQDLITDGIAQVQRLLDQGVDSKNITLDGISLGGGVATMVASHFHKIGKPVYLWNDRSFASLSKAAAGMIAPEMPGLFGDIVGSSVQSTSWSVMKPAGWEVNVAAAYDSIPDEYKGYMVVAKLSKKSKGDGVIAHKSSLHRGVKGKEKKRKHRTGHKVLAQSRLFNGGHNMPREDLISKKDPSKTGQDIFETFVLCHRR